MGTSFPSTLAAPLLETEDADCRSSAGASPGGGPARRFLRAAALRGGILAPALLALALLAVCGDGAKRATENPPPEAAVYGRLLADDGTPAGGLVIELCPSGGGTCYTGGTDAGGEWRIEAPAGAYILRFRQDGALDGEYFYYGLRKLIALEELASPVLLSRGERALGDLRMEPAREPAVRSTAPPQAAGVEPPPTRVAWQNGDWFLLGVNVPWLHWSCDFGVPSPAQPEFCESVDSVSTASAQEALRPRFRELRERGIHVVRWWVFPDDAWQILRDDEGRPSQLEDAVYDDFDAALRLANEFDLYYVFTLFSKPDAVPAAWLQDEEQHALLAEALRPLFARYGDDPRVLTWQVFNEPEWDIWNGRVASSSVRGLVEAIAGAVHDESDAYVSVGAATLDGLPFWQGLGLDYYTAHWYDPHTGTACAICTTFEAVARRHRLDAPLVIGEYFSATGDGAVERIVELYDRGYAGAWAWSLFPESTRDKLAIDLDALEAFAADRPDVGPQSDD